MTPQLEFVFLPQSSPLTKFAILPRNIPIGTPDAIIFANSITLTPGTVSVDIEDDKIIVHALNAELAEGVLNGKMDAKVTRLEGL